ncbi:MAG: LpxI family protein, partial [Planifilum fulgidum]
VKRGNVVAVEAMEGTDRCIRRAGEVGGKGFVVVKVAKPGQDVRFDLPTIGPTTIEILAAAGAAVRAFPAGLAYVLDEAATVAAADRAGIALVGLA